MKYYEINQRVLQLHKNDKVYSVEANRKLDNRYGVVFGTNGLVISATDVFVTDAEIKSLSVANDGKVTVYSGTIELICIMKDGIIYIGDCDCAHIGIQKDGCLKTNKSFLKKMQKMILTFENEAVLYVDNSCYPYRNYSDPHEFIDGILNPKIVYNPEGSILSFVKDKLGFKKSEENNNGKTDKID